MLIPLAAAQFLASYDTSSMNVAISSIVSDLGTTVTGVQTAISLFTLTMAALMIPGSKLTDIWGRRRCFRLGLAVYATGAFITALSPSLGFMIFGWSLLEGIGSALMIPPIYIIVTVSIPKMSDRAKAFGVVSAAAGLGSASGPLIGGIITTAITWRASFLMEVIAILVILYMSRHIPDHVPEEKHTLDLGGTILSAGGLVFVVMGILLAGTYGWLKARQDFSIGDTVLLSAGQISPVIILIAIGVGLLALFWLYSKARERRGKEPLVSTRLFNNKVSDLGLITQNSQWFIMIGTSFVISVYLQVSRGLNAIETGIALVPVTIGLLLASARAKKMFGRFSQRTIIRGGFVGILAGIVYIIFIFDPDSSIWLMAPGLFLVGFSAGAMLTASVNVVQSSVPDRDQGELSGVSRSVSNLGSSMGTAIAGAVLISSLISGVTTLTDESTVLNSEQQAQVKDALKGNVTALSDAQVQSMLEGQPQEVVDEVTRINADARNRALGLALLSVAVIGLIGLGAALLLPPDAKPQEESESQATG
jgi:MFS family permease